MAKPWFSMAKIQTTVEKQHYWVHQRKKNRQRRI